MKKYKFILIISLLFTLTGCSVSEIKESVAANKNDKFIKYADENNIDTSNDLASNLNDIADDLLNDPRGFALKYFQKYKMESNFNSKSVEVEYKSNYDGDTYNFITKSDYQQTNAAPRNSISWNKGDELIFDLGELSDHYDRKLAYVLVDNQLLGEKLLRQGLAKIRYVNEANTLYLDTYKEAQAYAQNEKLYLWDN